MYIRTLFYTHAAFLRSGRQSKIILPSEMGG